MAGRTISFQIQNDTFRTTVDGTPADKSLFDISTGPVVSTGSGSGAKDGEFEIKEDGVTFITIDSQDTVTAPTSDHLIDLHRKLNSRLMSDSKYGELVTHMKRMNAEINVLKNKVYDLENP